MILNTNPIGGGGVMNEDKAIDQGRRSGLNTKPLLRHNVDLYYIGIDVRCPARVSLGDVANAFHVNQVLTSRKGGMP